jgi:acetamidase/formamidase
MQRIDGLVADHQQLRWRPDAAPIAELEDGETFEVLLPDSSSGQLTADSTSADLHAVDLARVDAAVGPLAVRGARPGDALRLSLEAIEVGSWGWSGIFRSFGLLQDRFDDDLVIWRLTDGWAEAVRGFLRPVRLPLSPMLGWIGLAPAEGEWGMIPPRFHGGNLDNRLHRVGATVDLPVQVDGAHLLLGDAHALQGDGEVCGTGIETGALVRARVDVLRDGAGTGPRAMAPTEAAPPGRWIVTEGVGPDVVEAARVATEAMIGEIVARGFSSAEAYLLASLVGHLRLSEVVDLPNFVVSMVVSDSTLAAAAAVPPRR